MTHTGGSPTPSITILSLSGRNSIWLVPEYSKVAAEACTKFEVSRILKGHSKETNLDRISGTKCFLDPVKDPKRIAKITEVVLMRCPNAVGLDFKLVKRYDGMSGNISVSPSSALYLVWKTVDTSPV